MSADAALEYLPSIATAVICAVVVIVVASGLMPKRSRRRFTATPRLRNAVIAVFTLLLLLNALVAALEVGELFATVVAVCTVLGAIGPLVIALQSPAPQRLDTARVRTVLAVGAHPDDIELAAGGSLARFIDEGHQVHMLVMSGGGVGGDAGSRPDEARRAATLLGAHTIAVHDLPDTRLSTVEVEMTRLIEQTITMLAPDLVLTHSLHDQHQDHVAVHLAVLRAARQHQSLLCFESPSATRAFNPSVFVDIERYIDVKQAAIGLHRDQLSKPYMTEMSVGGVAAFRGRQGRLAAAEGFEPVRISLDLTEVNR